MQQIINPSKLPFHFPKTALNSFANSAPRFHFFNRIRHLILAISTLCLSLIVANAQAMNFAIICGKGKNASNSSIIDGPEDLKDNQQNLVLSAAAAGTLLGTLPINWIATKFGTRWMISLYGLTSSISTLLLPIAFPHFPLLLAIRIFQGFAVAISYIAMGTITSEWAPLTESGLSICLISCHFQLAPLLINPLAGKFCESGWQWTFYISGTVSLLSCLLFFVIFRDSPKQHCLVSEWERRIIGEGKTQICEMEKKQKVPYLKMLSDFVVWGLLISNVGATFGNQIFYTLGPKYLNIVFEDEEKTWTGFLSAFPYSLAIGVKLLAGPLSDWAGSRMSEKARVILFTSISQFVMAVLFLTISLLPNSHKIPLLCCYTAVTPFAGLWQVGAVKCAQLAARHFSSSIFSWNTFISCTIVLILPQLTNNNGDGKGQIEHWSRIFMAIAAIQVLTTFFFNFTVRVAPRPWAIGKGKNQEGDEEERGNVEKY